MSAASLRSGDLARLTGVSADTIRHYERLGILKESPRTTGGYRIYSTDAIERVRLAQQALQLGFSLVELSDIFRTREKGDAPCHKVLDLTEQKLRLLGREIQELQKRQAYMRQLVRQWRRKLNGTGPGRKAMLLQSLAKKPMRRSTPPTNNLRMRSC